MPTVNLSEFYATALEAAGSSAGVIVPDGPYRVRLDVIKKDQTKGTNGAEKKFKVNLKWVILEGPYAGKGVWTQQTLSPGNAQAVGIYLRQLIELGVDEAFIRSGQVGPDALWDYVVKGTIGVVKFGHHDFNGKTNQDYKGFQLESIPTPGVTPGGGFPAPAAPAVEVAAPVAVVPAAPPVVVVPAPVAPVTPPVVVAVPPLPQAAPAAPAAVIPQSTPTGVTITF